LPVGVAPLPYGAEARSRLDSAVLRIVKNADPGAAADMRAISQGFAAAQAEPQVRMFWTVCAGFFEALAQQALKPDLYAKRVASRVLMQYATLAKGEHGITERLLQDLLFFCAQAAPEPTAAAATPALQAVRQSFGLQRHPRWTTNGHALACSTLPAGAGTQAHCRGHRNLVGPGRR